MTPRPGDTVVARVQDPAGHTRLPRYVQGRPGQVMAERGVFGLPDELAHGGERTAHALLCVRFRSADLWPADQSERHDVYLDLFEDYLQPSTGEDAR